VRIITLTTDFGSQDWFVGTLKGVILGINPKAVVIDICHEIHPGDIRAGAFALSASYRFFAKGTVHVAVVDPGVGSARRAIAVETANYFFVGPDNGVLSFALKNEEIKEVRRLENERYFLKPVSHTFHGRDVFAPVAAHLSRGIAVSKFGSKQKEMVKLLWPEPAISRDRISGEVGYVDRFGNAITNIPNAFLPHAKKAGVFIRGKRVCAVESFYRFVPVGKPVAVPGSSGFLEIAINGGSAVKSLNLKIGAAVSIH
jgi:S-adenosylmethionine hydrolase